MRILQRLLLGAALAVLPGWAAESTRPADRLPAELEGVGVDQLLDSQVDLDLEFRDSDGRSVRLGEAFGDKPVILSLVYYECPMLCTLELNGLLKALRALSLEPVEDFQAVTVSIDPGETPELAAAKKREYVEKYGREGGAAGWRFLTGDQEQIAQLAESVGFRYRYDPATDLYRHASALIVLTPGGRVSRYQFGVEFSARDLKFALIEASDYKVGSPVDAVMLYCFHYDPTTGKYGFVVMNALRLGGLLTVALLGGFVLMSVLRDRRAARGSTA